MQQTAGVGREDKQWTSIRFPTPRCADFIDSRASVQPARPPSFVSGKRGVTFFRAMFVDRSGVQFAVPSGSATPNTHWKSKSAPRGEGGIQTLQGSSDRFFTEIVFNQKTRLPAAGFVAPRRRAFCCRPRVVSPMILVSTVNATLMVTSSGDKPRPHHTHMHDNMFLKNPGSNRSDQFRGGYLSQTSEHPASNPGHHGHISTQSPLTSRPLLSNPLPFICKI
jgi:hypothetical protein